MANITETKRVQLTDGSGRWFDREAAKNWPEEQKHDGRNFISVNTGTQWDHEILYRTKGGIWVLCCWSQWQGSETTYEEISEKRAYAWLAHQGCYDSEIPAEVLSATEI